MITASTLINIENAAKKDEVWDISALFLANWADAVQIRTSWVTDISDRMDGNEAALGLVSKPGRMISYRLLAETTAETSLLLSILARMGQARSLVPLFCDVVGLAANLSAGATEIACDPSYRRFFAGMRVVVADLCNAPTMVNSYEIRTIDHVEAGKITVTEAFSKSFTTTAVVLPLIECEVNLTSKITTQTDKTFEGTLNWREVAGPSALDPLLTPGTLPDDLPSYGGFPVLALPFQWEDLATGIVRGGSQSGLGTSQHTEVTGTRPRFTRDLKFLRYSRAEAWKLLRLFDSRGGRLHSFFVPSYTSDFTLVSVPNDTHLRLQAYGPLYNWNYRPYLALILKNGTVIIRKVTEYTRADSQDTVTLEEALPVDFSADQIERVCSAFLMRFDTDELVENWPTDTVMSVDIPVIEREDVVDVVQPIPSPFGGGGGGLPGGPVLPPDDGDQTPGYLKYRQGQDCVTGDAVDVWLPADQIPTLPATIGGPLGQCIFFTAGKTSRSPGTVIHEYTIFDDCADCLSGQTWIGTRKCSDNTQHNIWASNKAPRTLSGTWLDKANHVCFYFDPTLTAASPPAGANIYPDIEPVPSCTDSRCGQWEQALECGTGNPYPMWQPHSASQKASGTWLDLNAGKCYRWPDPPVLVDSPGQNPYPVISVEQIADCTDPRCSRCPTCGDLTGCPEAYILNVTSESASDGLQYALGTWTFSIVDGVYRTGTSADGWSWTLACANASPMKKWVLSGSRSGASAQIVMEAESLECCPPEGGWVITEMKNDHNQPPENPIYLDLQRAL